MSPREDKYDDWTRPMNPRRREEERQNQPPQQLSGNYAYPVPAPPPEKISPVQYDYQQQGYQHPYSGQPYPPQPYSQVSPTGKDGTVAYLLWFFLGGIGVHAFYLGQDRRGIGNAILSVCITIASVMFVILAVMGSGETPETTDYGMMYFAMGFALFGIIGFLILFVRWIIDAFRIPRLITGEFTYQRSKS